MVHRYFNAITYSLFGGGVATTCLGLKNYFDGKNVKCSSTDNEYISTIWDDNWDRCKPLIPEKTKVPRSAEDENKLNEQAERQKPTATRNIILVRHGQYNMQGKTPQERILTELGRKEADATGLRLKALDLPYSKIIHSTMPRAVETASIIHKHLPHLEMSSTDLLREGAPIPPIPPVMNYDPDEKDYFRDGARIEAAFRKIFYRAEPSQKENSYDVVVCHGNVIRYFVCRAMQFPPEAWLRFSLHHCSITWLAIRPNGRVVSYFVGDCGHLPKDLMTG